MQNAQNLSKRQALREKRQREQQRNRILGIVGMVVIAVFLAFLFIYSNLTPVEVMSVTPGDYPQTEMNTMGDPNAPVKLEVWEDFQCPACMNFSDKIEPLLIHNYVATGKVHYTYHHYPFIDDHSTTRESDQAANASMCAAEQGQFWDYKTILFANWQGENIGSFTDRRLLAFAESLGLEMNKFKVCFEANTYKGQIDQDFKDGAEVGVNGTPSIFVDRVFIANSINVQYLPTYEDIAAAIEAALAKAAP